ncbi:RteC domain-containing protein [Bizionia myxarmorum]|uniref:Tetracycline regulation of excision, RteC n=1 Tax=Bizionia myxarmorum TaxID=291186 RepID=A0A5D0R078_9FLAO|nr:RteC domain-containing protein [Bizionia myxarmorum]TYB74261.1 hypothetical protein ES674_13975 [Bizionia myxarmorum]
MNKINALIDDFKLKINSLPQDRLNEITYLKNYVSLSSEYLHLLRLYIREKDFSSQSDEIYFFKEVKPLINGHLKYFSHVHYYLLNRPKLSLPRQRKYIYLILKKFEIQKIREFDFVKYYRHKETRLDHIYFLRGTNNLAITNAICHFTDPEFSTSHDDLVAKIITYDLLMVYYKHELKLLKGNKNSLHTQQPICIPPGVSWTASKTDLVKLMYATFATGAFTNSNMDLKSLAKICETVFNIELGNFYKTYGEIKAREGSRTKFLDKMRTSLIKKMDNDYR